MYKRIDREFLKRPRLVYIEMDAVPYDPTMLVVVDNVGTTPTYDVWWYP